MEEPKEGYCTCTETAGVYAEVGEFGYWLRCTKCGKVVEDSFEYYNHYDGEDHYESDCW